jgi:hypothetical protein
MIQEQGKHFITPRFTIDFKQLCAAKPKSPPNLPPQPLQILPTKINPQFHPKRQMIRHLNSIS